MRAKARQVLSGLVILGGFYVASHYNCVLFHGLAETFSIAMATSIFVTLWNSRRFLDHGYYLLVGVAYLSAGSIDLVHLPAAGAR